MDREKTKSILYNVGIGFCLMVFIVGTTFIGVVIGESIGRASVQKENAELVLSYHETIQSKDDLIALLSRSTASAAQAAAQASEQNTTTALDASKQSVVAATSARHAAREARQALEAKTKEAALDAQKLKKLK